MYLEDVIEDKVQGQGVTMIFDLLGEGIRQPRKPSQAHPHGEVVPFHMRRGDVLLVGIALNSMLFGSIADGRAILPFRAWL